MTMWAPASKQRRPSSIAEATSLIDSTGLGLILEAWNLARRRGCDFAVLLPDGQVRRLFRESGLDQALPIIDGLPAIEYKDAGTGSGNGLRSTSRS
jgi:anti-anti-sigma factor